MILDLFPGNDKEEHIIISGFFAGPCFLSKQNRSIFFKTKPNFLFQPDQIFLF